MKYQEPISQLWLRPLPLMAALWIALFFVVLKQDFVTELYNYVALSNPEENFAEYGWKLYWVIIPCCVAGLSRPKENLPIMIMLLLAPPALFASYWLWEVFGWVVMLLYLCGVVGVSLISDDLDKYTGYIIYTIVIGIIYAVMRVLGGLFFHHWLGIADVGYVCLLGAYLIVIAIIEALSYTEEDVFASMKTKLKRHYRPSAATTFYAAIIVLTMYLICK